jgi:uncharacterized SAM-binding protein YcdF (DUF218 family)
MNDLRARWEHLYRELRDQRLAEFVLRARIVRETYGLHPADRPEQTRPMCRVHPLDAHPPHFT